MKHYIDLLYTRYETGEIDGGKSWIVSYRKDVDCFFCQKKSTGKVTKMANVENFIGIWNHRMQNAPRHHHHDDASINFYVENEYYSGYKCTYKTKVPVDIIGKYIGLLKDIHEESDKVDEKADAENDNIVR
ncbi:unnamed protein product [Absidia cylindrospora]